MLQRFLLIQTLMWNNWWVVDKRKCVSLISSWDHQAPTIESSYMLQSGFDSAHKLSFNSVELRCVKVKALHNGKILMFAFISFCINLIAVSCKQMHIRQLLHQFYLQDIRLELRDMILNYFQPMFYFYTPWKRSIKLWYTLQ